MLTHTHWGHGYVCKAGIGVVKADGIVCVEIFATVSEMLTHTQWCQGYVCKAGIGVVKADRIVCVEIFATVSALSTHTLGSRLQHKDVKTCLLQAAALDRVCMQWP
jgi:hypothetical protein